MQHILVERKGLSAVRLEADCRTAEVETFLAANALLQGSTDDLFSFRANNADWNDFIPMIALGSEVQEKGERVVVSVPPRGGDSRRILLVPREGLWEKGTWFICRRAG